MSRIHSGKSVIIWVYSSKHITQTLNFVLCKPKAKPLKFLGFSLHCFAFRAQKDLNFSNSALMGISQMLLPSVVTDWIKREKIRTKGLGDFVLSPCLMEKP